MHIVIRDHILEGDNLDELAACLKMDAAFSAVDA